MRGSISNPPTHQPTNQPTNQPTSGLQLTSTSPIPHHLPATSQAPQKQNRLPFPVSGLLFLLEVSDAIFNGFSILLYGLNSLSMRGFDVGGVVCFCRWLSHKKPQTGERGGENPQAVSVSCGRPSLPSSPSLHDWPVPEGV